MCVTAVVYGFRANSDLHINQLRKVSNCIRSKAISRQMRDADHRLPENSIHSNFSGTEGVIQMNYNTIETGKRIKKAREELGFSQESFSECLHISRNHLARIVDDPYPGQFGNGQGAGQRKDQS